VVLATILSIFVSGGRRLLRFLMSTLKTRSGYQGEAGVGLSRAFDQYWDKPFFQTRGFLSATFLL